MGIQFFTNKLLQPVAIPAGATYLEPDRAILTKVLQQPGSIPERKRVLFNPSAFSIAIEANYQTQEVPGLATHRAQYVNTRNPRVPIQLFFDQVELNAIRRNTLQGPVPGGTVSVAPPVVIGNEFLSAEDFQNFLVSLLYPLGDISDIRRAAPPVLIFSWPGFINITGIVRKLTMKYDSWTSFGQILRMTADLELEVLVRRSMANTTSMRNFGYQIG